MPSTSATDFAVSIRDEGYNCRLRVQGIDHAQIILQALSQGFMFKTSEPISENGQCVFRVAFSSQSSLRKLLGLLAGVPGLRVRFDPIRDEND